MKAPAALLLVAAGLFTAALASATPPPSATAEASATTPSWAAPAGCDARTADLASLFQPAAASPTATDMCGPCTLFLCKNAPVGAVCIIGNHRGFCVALNKCSDNVTWQCDCRLPG